MFKVTKIDSNRLDIELSEIEGALLPWIEIKTFNLDQRTQAENWLNR